MTTRAKTRLLFAVLAMMFVWPPVQHLLTRQTDANPWKFFGWAMYCTPAPAPYVSVRTSSNARELSLPSLLASRKNGLATVRRFTETRRIWGRLYGPDELASEIFASRSDLHAILVYVNTVHLSPVTAMPSHNTDVYECQKDRSAVCERRVVSTQAL